MGKVVYSSLTLKASKEVEVYPRNLDMTEKRIPVSGGLYSTKNWPEIYPLMADTRPSSTIIIFLMLVKPWIRTAIAMATNIINWIFSVVLVRSHACNLDAFV
jgi:hypothetical protein